MAIPVESPLRLLNDSRPRGTDWWEWSIWVEGPDGALDEVESVTYRLHPTFPQPVQNVTDRSDKFRLRSAGWGEFTVRAEAHLRTGRTIALERWLELRDDKGGRASDRAGAGGRRPSVFISASSLDGELVADLAKALREQGIEARGENDLVADVGDPASYIDRALREADGVVAVFSEPRSPWVEREFERARELRKPTFPVILGETYVPSGVTQTVRFELKARHNVEGLANLIAARLKDKLIPDESESELLETVRRAPAVRGSGTSGKGSPLDAAAARSIKQIIVCTPKRLPAEMLIEAARTAVEINPLNQPPMHRLTRLMPEFVATPERIAAVTTKYWGIGGVRLTVGFMDNPPANLRRRILLHMNAWSAFANVKFVETRRDAQVRIAREDGEDGGYWSYLGTDILHVPKDRQTMNLEALSMDTPEREYHSVVRHQTGHTLGFPHERMRKALVDRIDPGKAIEFFMRTQGWSEEEIRAQVLTPLEQSSLLGTAANPKSIMCYQIPGFLTKDGKPILGGRDIDRSDAAFAAKIYPKKGLSRRTVVKAAARKPAAAKLTAQSSG